MLGLSAAAGPAEVAVEVWGHPGFQTGRELVATVMDTDGRPCAVDADGVTCFEDDGTEAWGVDLPGLGIEDVASAGGVWALFGASDVVYVSATTGDELDRAPDADGLSQGPDGRALQWSASWVYDVGDGVGFAIPDDIDAVDLLVSRDGRFGLVDAGGGLTWVDADGEELAYLDLDLGVDGGLRSIALGDGWALIDDDGVVVLGNDGNIRAEADIEASDLVFAEGEVWLATAEGVVPMDPRTGALGAALVDGAVRSLAVADDGEVLAVVDVGGRRLRTWVGDEPVHGVDHTDAVVRLAPLPDGGLVSVDASGRAVRWSSTGVASALADSVDDAVLDGTGGLWVAADGELERVGGDAILVAAAGSAAGPEAGPSPGVGGAGLVGAAVPDAARLVALPDGVLVGDGAASVARLDGSGRVVWTSDDLGHADGLGVSGGVVVGLAAGIAEVADLATGSPRRRLAWPGEDLLAAGVAVGGLVVVGERDGVVAGWRPPRTGRVGELREVAESVALAPNGRWGAALRDDGGVAIFETQGSVLYRGKPGADVTALAVDERFVWLGRQDGRIERWSVDAVVVDAALPRFNPYAQLEDFVAAPAGPEPREQTRRSGPVFDLDARPDGALAVSSGALDTSVPLPDGGASRWVAVPDPERSYTAVLWDPQLGLVVGTDEGRLLGIRGTKERTLARLQGPVTALCAVPDGLLVSTGRGVVKVVGGKVRRVPGAPRDPVGGLACDPEGSWALAVQGDAAVAWSLVDGAVLARPRQGGPIRSVGVLPDGTALTGGEDRAVVLWEPVHWQPIAVLEGHDGAVVDLDVDPDGLRLVAAGGSGALVWDLVPLLPAARLDAGERAAAVTIDGTGRQVWIGTTQGGVSRYELPPPVGRRVRDPGDSDDTDAPDVEIIRDVPPPKIAPGALSKEKR